jgi:hypothetical protein
MIRAGLILSFLIFVGCSADWNPEGFVHEDQSKGKQEFLKDSQKCLAEKDKFSHKIQGREFGFEGEHAGYLGCMKLKGWSQKAT